jgi:nucleoside-diphosphate-sugar epimerase
MVVVTGAGGFIGTHLVAALAASGYEVRAVVRRHPPKDAVPGISHCLVSDIADADWGPILSGADAVVHLAAIAHRRDSGDRARVRAVNVTAVSGLAMAAAAAQVRRLVLVSSVGVLGANSGNGSFAADAAPNPHDFYSLTKLEAEQAAQRVADDGGLELSIVRPPLVFGPDAPGNFGRLVRLIGSPWPLPFGAIHNRRSLVSVWNLCDFLIACITSAGALGPPLLVADDEAISTSELLRACNEILGRHTPIVAVPVPIVRLAGTLLGRRGDIERLCQSLRVDTHTSKARLGWKPPLSLRQGLTRTLRPGGG